MTANSLLIQHRQATRLEAEPDDIDPRSEPMAALPLMGRVSAGQPLEAIEDPDWVQVLERQCIEMDRLYDRLTLSATMKARVSEEVAQLLENALH